MGRSKNSGIIVEYTRADGSVQKAILRYAEQSAEFAPPGHAFLRLLDDDLKTVVGQGGKESIVVKPLNALRRIGFFD